DRQPGQGVNFYSKEKEAALGAQLAGEMRQHTTPAASAAVSDYVKRVGDRLAAHLPNDWTWQIATVREDPGAPTHEPVALPGGYIFVSEYLIADAHSEAEFAGMLAHAMAHVVDRHWARGETRADLAAVTYVPAGGSPPAIPLGVLAFQRAFELEADYLAVKTMAAAGFDPAGLAAYIERMQPKPGQMSQVFSSFPDRDKRVAELQKAIAQLPAAAYQSGDEFARVQSLVRIPAPAPHLIR